MTGTRVIPSFVGLYLSPSPFVHSNLCVIQCFLWSTALSHQQSLSLTSRASSSANSGNVVRFREGEASASASQKAWWTFQLKCGFFQINPKSFIIKCSVGDWVSPLSVSKSPLSTNLENGSFLNFETVSSYFQLLRPSESFCFQHSDGFSFHLPASSWSYGSGLLSTLQIFLGWIFEFRALFVKLKVMWSCKYFFLLMK